MATNKQETPVMTASDLFAVSQGSINFDAGTNQQCHWCGSKCNMDWRHDDLAPIPFQKNKNQAKYPSSHYICVGCWLWRRARVTVTFLDGLYKDSQSASRHSWWITDSDARSINADCQKGLHPYLLSPPNRFVLSLTDGKTPNHLHLAVANDISIIESSTPLFFTFNNIVSEYTVYDLEVALKDKDASRTPGVRVLLNWFTPWESVQAEKKRNVGKPKEIQVTDTTKKVIQVSGTPNNK